MSYSKLRKPPKGSIVLNSLYQLHQSQTNKRGVVSPLFVKMLASDNSYNDNGSSDIVDNDTNEVQHLRTVEESYSCQRFLEININGLSNLLSLDYISFISYLLYDESLLNFLKSYLMFRPSAYLQNLHSSCDLEVIDKKVQFLFYRVFQDKYEEAIEKHLTVSSHPISVYHSKTPATSSSSVSQRVSSAFLEIVNYIEVLTMESIFDFLIIANNYNSVLASKFLIKFVETKIEYKPAMTKLIKHHQSMIQEMLDMFKPKKASVQKATTSMSIIEALQLSRDITSSWLLFVYNSYLADSADSNTLHPLCVFFCGNQTGLSSIGFEFISIMISLYELGLANITNRIKNEPNIQYQSLISTIRKNILSLIDWLVRVSVQCLEPLKSTDIDMLQTSDWTIGGSLSWIEWTQRVITHDYEHESSGSFIADFTLVNEENYRKLLHLCSNNDTDLVNMLIESCMEYKGYASEQLNEQIQKNVPTIKVDDTLTSSNDNSLSIEIDTIDNFELLRSIFPSHEEQFLKTCLSYYSFMQKQDQYRVSLDSIIDNILSDSLPSEIHKYSATVKALSVNDVKKITIGKASLNHLLDKSNEETKEFMKIQRNVIKKLEENELENIRVVQDLDDYNDDYDDQYDDVIHFPVNDGSTANDEYEVKKVSDTVQKKQVIKTPEINWEVRMKDTKRYNTLLKAEEDEILFWQSMKNTNRNNDALDLKSDVNIQSTEVGDSKKSHQERQKMSSANETKKEESKPKFRTKHFDKHHQRDKALRKHNI